ncbi:MAG: S8 family serine peptidase [Wenzhouxiangellaceae bacterium]|nr:S8 family serine peptidase [Wenzhouxiangellaceae bacterium]
MKRVLFCIFATAVPFGLSASDSARPLINPDVLQSPAQLASTPAPLTQNETLAVKQAAGHSALARRANRPSAKKGQKPGIATAQSHLLNKNGQALMEIRFQPATREAGRSALRAAGADIHTRLTPNLVEAWVAPGQLKNLQRSLSGAMIRPARIAQPTGTPMRAGSVQSEAIAASNIGPYHALGADGSGQIITVIDQGFTGWQALQASGDWPANARLKRYQMNGDTVIDCSSTNCTDFETTDHGANTVELAFDAAPGATYRVYRVLTIGEWYAAMLHASDSAAHIDGRAANVISASLSAPLDGIGDGSACPPNWGNPCGTIAEAAEIAQSRGTTVVNAAANNAKNHWGGNYAPLAAAVGDWQDALDFGGGTTLNISPFCLAEGFPIRVEMFWADWDRVDHDYDLFLFQRNQGNGGSGWTEVAASIDFQRGDIAMQNPQEFLSHTASGTSRDCNNGFSQYAIQIRRWDAPGNRNIQLFNNFGLGTRVAERSLGFPADSPAVFAVGALDLAQGNGVLADFSSQGPILAPGGGLPNAANPAEFDKPDGVNFSGVSTASAGPAGFGGTSAAAPHVAGMAAILGQLRAEKTVTTTANPANAISLGLNWSGIMGNNDLGPIGHDNQHGNGRIGLHECRQQLTIQAETWHQVAPACERRIFNSVLETFAANSTLGLYGTDWAMWEWNAQAEAYRRLEITDPLSVSASYWLYSFQDASVTLEGLLADITEAIPYPVTGAPDLGRPNMIANPRDFELQWTKVRFYYDNAEHDFFEAVTDQKIRSMMWTWDSGAQQYQESNGLVFEGSAGPGQGFWIRPLDDIEVRIPTAASVVQARSALDPARSSQTASQNDWMTSLQVVDENGNRASVRIGQHIDARPGFGLFDAERLGKLGGRGLDMQLTSTDIRAGGLRLMRDIRNPTEREFWTIEIISQNGGPATLNWDGPQHILQASSLTGPGGRMINADRKSGNIEISLEPGVNFLTWQLDTSDASKPRK